MLAISVGGSRAEETKSNAGVCSLVKVVPNRGPTSNGRAAMRIEIGFNPLTDQVRIQGTVIEVVRKSQFTKI